MTNEPNPLDPDDKSRQPQPADSISETPSDPSQNFEPAAGADPNHESIGLVDTGEWDAQIAADTAAREARDAAYKAKIEAGSTIGLASANDDGTPIVVRDFTFQPDPPTPQEVFDKLYAQHLAYLKGHEGGRRLVLRENRTAKRGGAANSWTQVDVSGYDLTDADLSGCTLNNWKFTKTKLINVNMDGVRANYCDFAEAVIDRGSWIVESVWGSNFGARRVDGATIMGPAEFPKDHTKLPIFVKSESHSAELGHYVDGRDHLPYEQRFDFRPHTNTIVTAANVEGASGLNINVLYAVRESKGKLDPAQTQTLEAALEARRKAAGASHQRARK